MKNKVKIITRGLIFDFYNRDKKFYKYLTTKLASKKINDNYKTVNQIFNYVFKNYK